MVSEHAVTAAGPGPERPVVVGYNGRPHSRDALAWAAADAASRGLPLVVLYAANYSGMVAEPGAGLPDLEPGAFEAAEEITTRGVAEALQAQPGLRVVGATEVTSPTQALTEAGAEADLVVIGTRGHGPTIGALLGSVAFTVAARAACPVIIVTGDAGARPVGSHAVVVGTDGSDQAAAAVRFAADRAQAAGADLEIITCTGGRDVPELHPARLAAAADAIARAAAARVRGTHPGLAVTTRVEDCPPERALVDASADAGLVVVGTRGQGALQGLFLGSVSHAVIHDASCPVAVITDVER